MSNEKERKKSSGVGTMTSSTEGGKTQQKTHVQEGRKGDENSITSTRKNVSHVRRGPTENERRMRPNFGEEERASMAAEKGSWRVSSKARTSLVPEGKKDDFGKKKEGRKCQRFLTDKKG